MNKRIALLEMELKDKTNTHSETKKHSSELERLTFRLEADLHSFVPILKVLRLLRILNPRFRALDVRKGKERKISAHC